MVPGWLIESKKHTAKNVQKQRAWLTSFLADCLEKGIETGEFNKVPVTETVSLLIAMINGLIRQRGLKLEHMAGMKEETVRFCKRSLVKN